jgi:hypothetical protein
MLENICLKEVTIRERQARQHNNNVNVSRMEYSQFSCTVPVNRIYQYILLRTIIKMRE